jgi:DNA polymerase III alpha subunit
LAARAASEGMTHLALTDANALYGAVRFAQACEKVGVQPIIGMALTVAPPAALPPTVGSEPGLLALLATGPDGYRSLARLSSHLDQFAELCLDFNLETSGHGRLKGATIAITCRRFLSRLSKGWKRT